MRFKDSRSDCVASSNSACCTSISSNFFCEIAKRSLSATVSSASSAIAVACLAHERALRATRTAIPAPIAPRLWISVWITSLKSRFSVRKARRGASLLHAPRPRARRALLKSVDNSTVSDETISLEQKKSAKKSGATPHGAGKRLKLGKKLGGGPPQKFFQTESSTAPTTTDAVTSSGFPA